MSRLNQLAINDEGFVFDPSTGESFTLNPTGLAILKAMKEQKTSREIAEELQEHFESPPEDIERDVIDFIAHLRTYHLI
jgi:PqqD family protein of HPr-rel-A system